MNTFAHSLHNSQSKEDVVSSRQVLKNALSELLPTKEEFVENFKELKFSKQNIPTNMLAKHIINRWEAILNDSDVFESESSIEHILDENSDNDVTTMVGNLLLLEQRINSNILCGLTLEDKFRYYSDSKYVMVEKFIDEHSNDVDWSEENIINRTETFGCELYEKLTELVKNI